MLLAIDVGNTQTVIGLYADADSPELIDHWRVATNAERTSDEHVLLLQEFLGFQGVRFDEDIDGVAVSSGVPRVTAALREMTTRYFGFPALVLGPGVRTGMPILPIAHNAGEYWGRYAFRKRAGTVRVVIGPLIATRGRDAISVNNEVEGWIEEQMRLISPERYAGA